MKILYITDGKGLDYQNDCLLIGLKQLLGGDVIDSNKRLHLYKSYDKNILCKLRGRGMTSTRILDDLEIDRTDILNKIKTKFFDFIIYGSIWRNREYLKDVLEKYPTNKIIIIDGEDHRGIYPVYNQGVYYFKRELVHDRGSLYPISFAIPHCKLSEPVEKKRNIAFCNPNDRSTYIYKTEEDYYMGYRESRFAYTKKKAGWDCRRHYEIIINRCIPIFEDIENCPVLTMTNFPKTLCLEINQSIKNNMDLEELYNNFHVEFYNKIQELTTEELAKYVLNITKFKN